VKKPRKGKTERNKETKMKTEIETKLEELALKKTIPFCYGCYKDAPTGRCITCGSDDLMRHLPAVGVEYGTDWVIKNILEEELTPVDLDSAFEDFMRECYPETSIVGFITNVDTISAIKELDPVAWRYAQSDWESQEESEENLITFDNGVTYYRLEDLEELTS
jgi:hypothetical protein